MDSKVNINDCLNKAKLIRYNGVLGTFVPNLMPEELNIHVLSLPIEKTVTFSSETKDKERVASPSGPASLKLNEFSGSVEELAERWFSHSELLIDKELFGEIREAYYSNSLNFIEGVRARLRAMKTLNQGVVTGPLENQLNICLSQLSSHYRRIARA